MNSGLLKQKRNLLEDLQRARGPEKPGKRPKSVCGRNWYHEDTPGSGCFCLHQAEMGFQLESLLVPFLETRYSSATVAATLARIDDAQALLLCVISSQRLT